MDVKTLGASKVLAIFFFILRYALTIPQLLSREATIRYAFT
jgi:hypothetical protein